MHPPMSTQEFPHQPGEVISYLEMCQAWSVSFQKGMHFRLRPGFSVILMSRRRNAPYRDCVEENGRVLIYEGHDIPRKEGCLPPKNADQPRKSPNGKLTQNGLFEEAALKAKRGDGSPETVAVYEKIHTGIWAFNGLFLLADSYQESDGNRLVFKFRLELTDSPNLPGIHSYALPHTRIIPSEVKQAVWKRDRGKCIQCGATDNLHFDHDIPYSKGGSSLVVENIRLLCARHNLSKRDRIE
jgi:hypothetical protein